MTSMLRRIRPLPPAKLTAVLGGVAVKGLLIVALAIPSKVEPSISNVFSISLIGFIGGGVTGKLTNEGDRAGIWHGFLAGSIGGLGFGVLLVYTFIYNKIRGIFWAINYWLITTFPFPSELVVRHGSGIVVLIGLISGVIVAASSAVAGGLTANSRHLVTTNQP